MLCLIFYIIPVPIPYMYTLAVYDESSSYQFSYLNRTDNTNYKRCFQKGIPLIPIQPRRKTAKPRYRIFLKIQKYRKDHPSNSHFEWIETSCIIANFHLPGCTYFPWRARRTFIRVLVPWMKVRGVLGSVPSLELRVHTRVKDTFVLHARLCGFDDDYVTSSHGNQCSWPPTRSHGAKPTRPASFGRLCERAFYLFLFLRFAPWAVSLPLASYHARLLSFSPYFPPCLTFPPSLFPFCLFLFTSASYLSTLFREDYSRWCNNVFTRRTCRVIPTVLPDRTKPSNAIWWLFAWHGDSFSKRAARWWFMKGSLGFYCYLRDGAQA